MDVVLLYSKKDKLSHNKIASLYQVKVHLRNEDQIKKADLVLAIHFKAKIPKKVAKLLPPSALVLGPDQLQVEQIDLQGLCPKAQAIAITALGLMLLG